jgi:hypothetical protein
MAIFNSYVSLPEGTVLLNIIIVIIMIYIYIFMVHMVHNLCIFWLSKTSDTHSYISYYYPLDIRHPLCPIKTIYIYTYTVYIIDTDVHINIYIY